MTARKILVALVLVAGLGAYLYLHELPQAEREAQTEKLLDVTEDAITEVTLAYPDRAITLRRGDAGWRLTSPVDAEADETAVQGLLRTVVGAEIQRTLDELPRDLADFGLESPSVTVTLALREGAPPPKLTLGKNTSIGGKTYVRRGDEPRLHLVSSSVQVGLGKEPKDLRNKQLLRFEDDDVTRVEIVRRAEVPVLLVRGDSDGWTVQPGEHVADSTEVRSYLASLRSARAVGFADDAPSDLAAYGLATPRLTVSLVTGDDERQTLVLGGETKEDDQTRVFAKRAEQPTIYTLGDWSFRSLDKGVPQFRDKTVLRFEPSDVTRIELVRDEGPGAVLVRADAWRLEPGSADSTANESAVTRLLEDLQDLRGSEIVAEPPGDLASFGLDAPEVRLTLTGSDDTPIGTLLGARHDGKHYVMVEGGDLVLEARDYMYGRLDKERADLVEAKPETPADDTEG